MAQHMVFKHLLVGLVKGSIADWALQKMALHVGLVVSCFNIIRKNAIAYGAFPDRILEYKGNANNFKFVFVFFLQKEEKKLLVRYHQLWASLSDL